jgi:aquaporin Z
MRDFTSYAIELAATAIILAAAGFYTVAVQYHGSPLHAVLPDAAMRRAVVGLLMGATVASIVYSPWGRRSGAHLNPAITLTFLRLRKVAASDAAAYVAAQFAGALLGVGAVAGVFRAALADPAVRWFVTVPGIGGTAVAFLGEVAVTAVLMTIVLRSMGSPRWRPYTGLLAGVVVASAIAFESPLSGSGLNPARSMATAAFSGIWTAWWVYLVAPPIGMLAAAEIFVRSGSRPVPCAKLVHDRGRPCHFLNCALSGGSS